MPRIIFGIYNVASVQRLLDFIKTVYAFGIGTPAIIKPSGAAAQVGVPEAHRFSYKYDKPLIVLPELTDLKEVLGIDKIYFLSKHGEEINIRNISLDEDMAIIIQGSDGEFTKAELQYGKPLKITNLPHDLPSHIKIAVLLYDIKRYLEQGID